MKTDDEMEAILTSAPTADKEKLAAWFEKRGIETVPMRAGLLLTGHVSKFAATFAIGVDELSAAGRDLISLTIPKELSADIRSIIYRPDPKLHR